MNLNTVKSVIENILFIADRPLTLEKICELFNGEMDKSSIKVILDELKNDYKSRGIQLIEIAEGYQLSTRAEYSEWIKRFYNIDRGSRLSQASLETLSIIAYRQPITRAGIEEIRGVDSGGVIKTLLEKNLVRNMGRKKVIGRPMMYGTTRKFLEYFGLRNLTDLPTIDELKEDKSIRKEEIQGDLRLHKAVSPEEGMPEDRGVSSISDRVKGIENYNEQLNKSLNHEVDPPLNLVQDISREDSGETEPDKGEKN
ncbi:MAG: SMC-Scp complex subunit ScpB [Nitrospinae bacterium]|nr:SMC-Scp complex subunit ScpB [Nitrospinota bacterium]